MPIGIYGRSLLYMSSQQKIFYFLVTCIDLVCWVPVAWTRAESNPEHPIGGLNYVFVISSKEGVHYDRSESCGAGITR